MMVMGRVEDTAHEIADETAISGGRKVSVGEFRRFVNQTGYITDCERQDGGWVYAPRKQWVKKPDASWDNPYRPQEERDPVVLVSWYDAVIFANWKSTRDGLTAAYRVSKSDDLRTVEWDRLSEGYRLPTAQEWEQAVATAQTRPVFVVDAQTQMRAVAATSVLPPNLGCEGVVNGHGLEWCWDSSAAGLTAEPDHSVSPTTAPGARRRVIVEADKGISASDCRGTCHPLTAVGTLGFRLVKGPMPT